MEEKYEALFELFDPDHCLDFREVIRRLKKEQFDKETLVGALGENCSPTKLNKAAAIILVYHFLYCVEYKKLFRLLDCCGTDTDMEKVKRRIKSIDVERFDRDFLERLSCSPFEQCSKHLAGNLLKVLEQRAYQKKVENVMALF